jgi:hypothetical protein
MGKTQPLFALGALLLLQSTDAFLAGPLRPGKYTGHGAQAFRRAARGGACSALRMSEKEEGGATASKSRKLSFILPTVSVLSSVSCST